MNVGRKKSSNTVPVNTMATVWMLQPDTCQANQRGGLIAILVVPGGKQKGGNTPRGWLGGWPNNQDPSYGLIRKPCLIPTGDGLIEVQQLSFYTKWHAISNPSTQLLNKLPAACSKAVFDEILLSLHWALCKQSTLFFSSTLSRKSSAARWTFIQGPLSRFWMKICFTA